MVITMVILVCDDQVTLGEGPEHVAMFNDSSKVYNLKKEDEVSLYHHYTRDVVHNETVCVIVL